MKPPGIVKFVQVVYTVATLKNTASENPYTYLIPDIHLPATSEKIATGCVLYSLGIFF